MAPLALHWLSAPPHLSWLDLGCGTGALSEAIYQSCSPASLTCIDPSLPFLQMAKEKLPHDVQFICAGASNMPLADNTFDIAISGLALNFFPDLNKAFAEMKRVVKKSGTITAYVWDYGHPSFFLRLFWDAAIQSDPSARALDEARRFPVCNMTGLKAAFVAAGITDIETTSIELPTTFSSFDDLWNPFYGLQGPAPGYLATLSAESQENLKDNLRELLPIEHDGSIKLTAKVLCIRGVNPS